MRLAGRALRLMVFVGESDQWRHRPLYTEIVHRAHAAGLAGASVFRGVEGYGASSVVHTTRLLSLSEDLPMAVVVVDDEARVRGFLPQLDELVAEGLVVLDEVEVVRYSGRRGRSGVVRAEGDGSSAADGGQPGQAGPAGSAGPADGSGGAPGVGEDG